MIHEIKIFIMSIFNWKRTSPLILKNTEEELFACLEKKPEGQYVNLSQSNHDIWTVSFNRQIDKTALVFVHGMGSGVGLWVLNFLSLTRLQCPIYAFDLLGFGQSSRIKFPKSGEAVESEFITSIEEWREKNKINKMILLGHSLGGYLSTAYTLKYPQYIEHLILADPWGFPEKPVDQRSVLPWWARAIKFVLAPFNPFAALRALGPWGPQLIAKFRGDILANFEEIYPKPDIRIARYIYHCNAQNPSGEVAFTSLMQGFGYACNPMLKRIGSIPQHIPITFMHGEYSWIDKSTGYKVQQIRSDSKVDVHIIEGSGHHVYADNYRQFNDIVASVCISINKLEDIRLSSAAKAADAFDSSKSRNFRDGDNDEIDGEKEANTQAL